MMMPVLTSLSFFYFLLILALREKVVAGESHDPWHVALQMPLINLTNVDQAAAGKEPPPLNALVYNLVPHTAGGKKFAENLVGDNDAAKILRVCSKYVWRKLYYYYDAPKISQITLYVTDQMKAPAGSRNNPYLEIAEIYLRDTYVETIPGNADAVARNITGMLLYQMARVWQLKPKRSLLLLPAPPEILTGLAAALQIQSQIVPTDWKPGVGKYWLEGGTVTGYFFVYCHEKFTFRDFIAGMNYLVGTTSYSETRYFAFMTITKVELIWWLYKRKYPVKS